MNVYRTLSLVAFHKTSRHETAGISIFPRASTNVEARLDEANTNAWASRIQTNNPAMQTVEQWDVGISSSGLEAWAVPHQKSGWFGPLKA